MVLINPLTPFPYPTTPLGSGTPLTYREGITVLGLIEALKSWIEESVAPELHSAIELAVAEFTEGLTNAENTIIANKLEWQTLFDNFMENIALELQALNDVAVTALLGDPESQLSVALNTRFAPFSLVSHVDAVELSLSNRLVSVESLVVNVLDHGASPAIADNTSAIQSAVDYIRDTFNNKGATLYFPDGEYIVKDNVYLMAGEHDNITVTGSAGAVIRKTVGSTNYVVFAGLAGNNTGKGSGLKNFKLLNLTWRGDLANGVSLSAFSGNRAKGTRVIGNTFIETSQNGHVIDAMGFDDTVVKGNRFGGIKVIATREYTEAVQADSSVRTGAGFDVTGEIFDGTPTTNMRVENNVFESDTIDGVFYPAQSPFGSHSYVDGMPHTELVFKNNIITDCVDTSSSSFGGIIHFMGAQHVEISGNTVSGVVQKNNTFVRFVGGANAQSFASVNSDVVELVPATYPINAKHVKISQNTVNDISSTTNLIYLYGITTNRLDDIVVHDNTFNNCNIAGGAPMVIRISFSVEVEITDNKLNNCGTGIIAAYGTKAVVTGNRVTASSSDSITVLSYITAVISDSVTDGRILFDAVEINHGNNNVVNLRSTFNFSGIQILRATASIGKCVLTSNSVKGNAVTGAAISASDTSWGVVANNVVDGFTSSTFASNVNVVTPNNVWVQV